MCNWFVERFEAEHGHLRESNPQRFFDLFVEREIPGILMIRPAVQAAFDLNPASAWQTIQDGFKVDMRSLVLGNSGSGAPPHCMILPPSSAR